jgi:TBC1 domain family member 8/9
MFNLSSLVQKAQSFIEPSLSLNSTRSDRPSKAALFRHQFRLPESQNPLGEITAELTLSSNQSHRRGEGDNPGGPGRGGGRQGNAHEGMGGKDAGETGNRYVGKLHISERYLCFSTQSSSFLNTASTSSSSTFTGQTHGAGPAGNGFTLLLCGIRRIERLHSQSYMHALSITTWNGINYEGTGPAGKNNAQAAKPGIPAGQKLTLQLVGSTVQCNRFCDILKKGCREAIREVESLRVVVTDCQSEYMLGNKEREQPDTGLGTIFRYPGDPRKLKDPAKMRLWREYLRGWYLGYAQQVAK